MQHSFIDAYIEYTKESEPPAIYHRWCAISMIAAMLGRSIYFEHGHFRVFPNLYVMLIGEPGARKSTSIKVMKKIASNADYEKWAADKTTKEKFLLDLEGHVTDEMQDALNDKRLGKQYDKIMEQNLWGTTGVADKEPRETFIAADEFNEFAGAGNLEFYTTLGNLWDWDDDNKPFTQRLKNSRSVSIYQPTINILGGNTPENFARAFPPEIIGQGFLSRMLLVHGERSGRKYTFPPVPTKEKTDAIIGLLRTLISKAAIGSLERSAEADALLDRIYREWHELADVRFRSYSTRRFTQLLKLSIIVCVSNAAIIRDGCGNESLSLELSARDVIIANTYLSAIEILMPRALGEFGKAKNSDVANKILDLLNTAKRPMLMKDIWKEVNRDLDKITQLSELLASLQQAEKIQYVKEMGFLAKRSIAKKIDYVDWSVLTEEERKGVPL